MHLCTAFAAVTVVSFRPSIADPGLCLRALGWVQAEKADAGADRGGRERRDRRDKGDKGDKGDKKEAEDTTSKASPPVLQHRGPLSPQRPPPLCLAHNCPEHRF